MAGIMATDYLGLCPKSNHRVEGGGATGGICFQEAWKAVASGYMDVGAIAHGGPHIQVPQENDSGKRRPNQSTGKIQLGERRLLLGLLRLPASAFELFIADQPLVMELAGPVIIPLGGVALRPGCGGPALAPVSPRRPGTDR